jgi:hypothetical protein
VIDKAKPTKGLAAKVPSARQAAIAVPGAPNVPGGPVVATADGNPYWDLVAALNSGRVVPFLGAGVSMISPTSLPAAQELADDLTAKGYGAAGDDLEEVAETCWDRGGWQLFAQAISDVDWRARKPNACHVVIAELAAEGLISAVLTTNWDTALENALSRAEVMHTCVSRPQDLAVASPRAVRVVKLHGCIETPENIRAKRTDVDAVTWAADWAAEVFAVMLRTASILYAGYSGASRATTRTIQRISGDDKRSASDWVVGKKPREEATENSRTKDFLEASGVDGSRYVDAGAAEFFARLRDEIYVLLLERPRSIAKTLLSSLLSPTEIATEGVLTNLDACVAAWRDAGQARAQAELRTGFPVNGDRVYTPLIPHAGELGRYWAWLALMSHTGVVHLESPGLRALIGSDVQVVPVMCESAQRRDDVAPLALDLLANDADEPARRFVGVVVGGTGPMPTLAAKYDMVRAEGSPDIVRGRSVHVDWVAVDDAFGLASAGIAESDYAAALRSTLIATEPAGNAATDVP